MNHRAFTLIELLVVVAIIGILVVVGVVAYNGYTEVAKKKAIQTIYANNDKIPYEKNIDLFISIIAYNN